MPTIDVKELLKAGVHFGHRVSRWNPKMMPYIFGKRHQIHIIDLRETVRGLVRACRFMSQLVAEGKDVLFVGTKRQARATVRAMAEQCGMHFVDERWLGGTLTNHDTILSRLKRLEELERMEEDGTLKTYGKKAISMLMREKRRILRNLHGIRRMSRLPGALLVVDPRREVIAVREANRLHIPVVAIVDTDSDPDMVDIPIPANDDAMRSVQVILSKLTEAIMEGLGARTEGAQVPEEVVAVAAQPQSAASETVKPAAAPTSAKPPTREPSPRRPARPRTESKTKTEE